MDGLEATRTVMAESATCIVIVTGRAEVVEAVEEAGAMGYAPKPLLSHQLPALVETARGRFERFCALRGTSNGGALQSWLLLRKAVNLLTDGTDMSEEQAFAELDRIAAEGALSLPEAVERVLAGNRPVDA
jgi:AmiR/NasT family two-component response regulator